MNANFVDGLVGWGVGYNYANLKNKEDEVKQGKNYYLSNFIVPGQLAQFGVLISKINEIIPAHPLKIPVKIACNIGPILTLPLFLFLAAVKQGDYEKVAEWYHGSNYCFVQLPEKLSGRAVSFFSFFAEHSGNMIRVGVGVAAIGLIVLGNVAYGGAVLTAIAYESLDKMGFVPRRISLFMEIYMPTVSLIGLLIGGTALIRVFSAIMLSTQLSSSVTFYLHHKIDALVRYYFSDLRGPSLEEIDAPLVRQEEMSFDKIKEILDADMQPVFDMQSFSRVLSYGSDSKINPAHCSKSMIDFNDLPRDHHFDQFLTIFDSIDWTSKYELIKNKLKDDDRFIDFLFEKNPEVKQEDLANDIELYIKNLADEAEMTPEEYLADWMREQMVQLIAVLKGQKRVKGLQQDLDEAIQVCALLLPYLNSLENEVEKEDILLKLAIEGGDYCGRGVKRASNELLAGIYQNERQKKEDISDPIKNYELKIEQALKNKRSEIVQAFYQALANQLKVPNQISDDTHSFDVYRLYFSLGFFPLTEFERKRMGIAEMMNWEMFSPIREEMYSSYKLQLGNVVHEIGEAEFGIYISQIINENELLSDQQKEEILEKFTSCNEGQWSYEETLARFRRLLFTRLGVLTDSVAEADHLEVYPVAETDQLEELG